MAKPERLLTTLGAGLVLAMFAWAWLVSQAETDLDRLNAYLETNQATPKEREAYVFALEHPDVLKVIPCYCGCGRLGHKSNYNCFLQNKANANAPLGFDTHGFVCPMCVQIALVSKKMFENGLSVKEIRDYVDQVYQKYPHLHATDTPQPVYKTDTPVPVSP